jgi:hypothetical protein
MFVSYLSFLRSDIFLITSQFCVGDSSFLNPGQKEMKNLLLTAATHRDSPSILIKDVG